MEYSISVSDLGAGFPALMLEQAFKRKELGAKCLYIDSTSSKPFIDNDAVTYKYVPLSSGVEGIIGALELLKLKCQKYVVVVPYAFNYAQSEIDAECLKSYLDTTSNSNIIVLLGGCGNESVIRMKQLLKNDDSKIQYSWFESSSVELMANEGVFDKEVAAKLMLLKRVSRDDMIIHTLIRESEGVSYVPNETKIQKTTRELFKD